MSFPVKTITQLECCLDKLEDRVDLIEGDGVNDAILDLDPSTVAGVDAAGDPPTEAEFNALVAQLNLLVIDHNAVVTTLNNALQVLRDHNLLDT